LVIWFTNKIDLSRVSLVSQILNSEAIVAFDTINHILWLVLNRALRDYINTDSVYKL